MSLRSSDDHANRHQYEDNADANLLSENRSSLRPEQMPHSQGYIGYWIASEFAGRGITTTAVAMLTDHALLDMGLHRVEINIRPENAASIRVVEKNGFHFEGLRPRYLHIDGDWRDHHCYVMTSESLLSGGITRLRPSSH